MIMMKQVIHYYSVVQLAPELNNRLPTSASPDSSSAEQESAIPAIAIRGLARSIQERIEFRI